MSPERAGLTVIPLEGIGEVRPGDDLPAIVGDALERTPDALPLETGDVLVVTQKIVSKAEGAVVDLRTVTPRPEAVEFAERYDRDPRQIEVVLREARRVVRMERGVLITETPHGFVCANAGVDASNVPGEDVVCLLPRDPDATARALHQALKEATGAHIAVIIADSFGRPWRNGIVNVAIGAAGIAPLVDYRGQLDDFGRTMQVSVLAVADELASAAELVMGKVNRCPMALIRGYPYARSDGSARDLIMDSASDMFR